MATETSQKRTYYCAMERPLCMEKHQWNWVWLTPAHIFGVHGLYMWFTGNLPFLTAIPLFFFGYFAGIGITVGCHRYWSHKTFKAKLPLQIVLAYAQTMAAQYPIFKWCRDHRIHHKYTETDADPHDASRGFFFAHMGWLMEKENPAVRKMEDTIDLSDLDNDPVVRFQTKYYWVLLFIAVFVVPMSIFHLAFPELTFYQLFCCNYVWYLVALHFTWLVNSAAHFYGFQPYDTQIRARENPWVSILAIGEGWHNYHHTFPWDYRTSELGTYARNLSALIIDTCASLGLAYDLKTVPHDVVMQRVKRTGDVHLHEKFSNVEHTNANVSKDDDNANLDSTPKTTLPPWGWGDKDIPKDHFDVTEILSPSPTFAKMR